jgi:uncharacterized protein YozE (UPF0346 family)
MKIKDLHLLAFYVVKPRDPKMTSQKGYMSDPANHQYDERVEFTRGLSSKDQIYAAVILNLNKKTVVANRYDVTKQNSDFDHLFKYFLEGYPQYVVKVMQELDPEYLAQFLPKEKPATENAKETTE